MGIISTRITLEDNIPNDSGIKVSSISKSEIAKTTILTPPYDVQRKVASVLSEVDHLIEKEAETVIVLQKLGVGCYSNSSYK